MVTDNGTAQLQREIDTIHSAIAMVASGQSPRVTVAGLRFGDTLLEVAERLAEQAGVRIVPLWTSDEGGADLVVERLDG